MGKRGRPSAHLNKTSSNMTKNAPLSNSGMQSSLFNPDSGTTGVTSLVVPETPTTSPCPSTTTNFSTVSSILETPDDLTSDTLNKESNPIKNANKQVENNIHKNEYGHQSTSTNNNEESDESDDDAFDFAADLTKCRRMRLSSILESEHSFSRSLKMKRMKNSSMLHGQQDNNNRKNQSKLVDSNAVVSPVKRSKRRSLAEVILPFDLNDKDILTNKLINIQKSKQKMRRSVTTPTTPKETFWTPPSRKSNVTQNVTRLFDSEDLDLTSVQGSSQKFIEDSVENIIEGLESENLDKTEANAGVESSAVGQGSKMNPVASIQDVGTGSTQKLRGRDTKMKDMSKLLPGANARTLLELKDNSTGSSTKKTHPVEDVGNSVQNEQAGPPPALDTILRGVVAYVEVRMGHDNRSAVIKNQLKALGAEVQEKLSANVTHVIFKDGTKSVFNRAIKRGLHLVSSLWVEECREKLEHVSEAHFPSSSFETYRAPLFPAKLRKLRSMQPKEFSEEEVIAAARARRRLKSQNSSVSSSSAANELQFFSPQQNTAKNEAIGSPLFGISHLLTPQRRNSGSSSSSEEDDRPIDLPTRLHTPLAQRLYDRFTSPRTGSYKRYEGTPRRQEDTPSRVREDLGKKSAGEKPIETLAIANMECQMTTVRNENSASDLQTNCDSNIGGCEQVNSNLVIAQKYKQINLDQCAGEVEYVGNKDGNKIKMPSPLSTKTSEPKIKEASKVTKDKRCQPLRRSSRLERKLPGLSLISQSLRHECGITKDIGSSSVFSDSSQNTSDSTDELTPCWVVIEKSSDLRHCGGSPRIFQRVPQKRKSQSSVTEESDCSAKEKSPKPSVGPVQTNAEKITETLAMTSEVAQSREERSVGSQKGREVSGLNKGKNVRTVVNSREQKTNTEVQRNKQTNTSLTNNSNRLLSGKGKGDWIKVKRERHCSCNLPETTATQSSKLLGSQCFYGFSSSQGGRRKLLSMDTLEPSQDLVIPVTPDRRDSASQGPYRDLQIRGSKTQRGELKNRKNISLSHPLPLPRNNASKSCKDKIGIASCSNDASDFDDGISLRVKALDPASTLKLSCELSSVDETSCSSGDESVFQKSKIHPIPRSRRSTEEFQFCNGLNPTLVKKGRGRLPSKKSLCLTSVHSKEMEGLIPIIMKLGGYKLTKNVCSNTSHVVCGEARRTLNLLFGIARGCWIVDVSWVYRSLEMGTWMSEEPFELFTFCPGAKICRQQRENQKSMYQQTLFSGVGSIFVQEGCIPSSSHLQDLLQLCGASVVSHIRTANVVIGRPSATSGKRGNFAPITHVSEKWVLDSVQHHRVQPLPDYVLK